MRTKIKGGNQKRAFETVSGEIRLGHHRGTKRTKVDMVIEVRPSCLRQVKKKKRKTFRSYQSKSIVIMLLSNVHEPIVELTNWHDASAFENNALGPRCVTCLSLFTQRQRSNWIVLRQTLDCMYACTSVTRKQSKFSQVEWLRRQFANKMNKRVVFFQKVHTYFYKVQEDTI